MSMPDITCQLNPSHTMVFDKEGKNGAGYYCTKCKYEELDRDLNDGLIDSQCARRVFL